MSKPVPIVLNPTGPRQMREIKRLRDEDGVTRHPLEAYLPQSAPGSQEADELDEHVPEIGKRNESIPWINLFQDDFNNAPNNDSDDLEGLLLQRDLFVQGFGQPYAAMTWYGHFGNDSQDIQLPIWDHFEGLRHVAGEMCFHVEECGLGCKWPKLLSREIRWR
jgi:hypothetical protein